MSESDKSDRYSSYGTEPGVVSNNNSDLRVPWEHTVVAPQ